MRLTGKRIVVVTATTSMVVLSAGVAYAYWTTTGTGSGSAGAGTTTTVTVVQTNAAITGLIPGATPAALSGVFSNNLSGAVPVKVGPVTVSSVTVDSGHSTCTPGDLTTGNIVIAGTDTLSAHTLAVGNPVGTWSGLTIELANLATNQDVCKSATFTVNYAVAAAP
jgi:hypothetical protein